MTVSQAGFGRTRAARYGDGVAVSIDRTRAGREQGQGPGSLAGRHFTSFTISVTNSSARAVDLNGVVVTASYGTPPRLASPVYAAAAPRDFTGTIAPGRSATADYAFAIPSGEQQVVAVVDLDAQHAAAQFTGAIS